MKSWRENPRWKIWFVVHHERNEFNMCDWTTIILFHFQQIWLFCVPNMHSQAHIRKNDLNQPTMVHIKTHLLIILVISACRCWIQCANEFLSTTIKIGYFTRDPINKYFSKGQRVSMSVYCIVYRVFGSGWRPYNNNIHIPVNISACHWKR